MVPSLWKTVRQFLKPLNTALAQDPAIACPGLHSGGVWTCPHERACTPVHSSTVPNSQKAEMIHVSTRGGLDKQKVVPLYDGILFGHKKE